MNLIEKLEAVAEERKSLLPTGLDAFGIPIETVHSPTEADIGGKRVLFLGTNNYLGLTFAPECIAAAHQAIDESGTGTTGSRMANGNYSGHRALEKELAEFFECRSAMIFTTGYQANLGTIAGLVGRGDTLLIDADCHASIYDGCRLTDADVIRFRHNDASDLEKRLRRLGEKASSTLIIVEGIYSMLGDRAPLNDIVRIKNEYNSYLLVDEAHSLGVLGKKGRGLVEESDALGQVDFITGTFSKSLGSIGGYCASNHPQLGELRYVSRPYIFTASSSPSAIESTRVALKLLERGTDLRRRLMDNAIRLYARLQSLGYQLGPDPGPIIAATVNAPRNALLLWQGLLDNGIYVNLVLPPASPDDKALVRCSVSAAHTREQIDEIGNVFEKLHQSIF